MASNSGALQTVVKVQSALTSIGSPPMEASDPSKVKGEETDSLVTGVKGSFLYMAAMVGVVAALCSLVMVVSHLVDISSLTLMFLAPLAIVQKRKLSSLGGMRGQQNKLRKTVNTLTAENNKLSSNVTKMRTNVDDLKTVDQELEKVVKRSGGQLDRMVTIIKENGKLQEQIKKNLECQVMQSVLAFTLKSDKNMDFTFSKSELKRLKISLSNIPGVTFDKANFDKLVGNRDLALTDVMTMFRNLKQDIPEEDNIFHITPEKILKKDSFFGL